jgi:hypothetical protein
MSASLVESFKSLLGKHSSPYVVWRNPALSLGSRRVHLCDATFRGRIYEVLEHIGRDRWSVATVLTVLDGGQNTKRAAVGKALVCPNCGGPDGKSASGFSFYERMACPDCGHQWTMRGSA